MSDAQAMAEEMARRMYAETLRADRAEANLREAERTLGRLLQMADAWADDEFPNKWHAKQYAAAVRTVMSSSARPAEPRRL